MPKPAKINAHTFFNSKSRWELLLISLFAIGVYQISSLFDLFEQMSDFVHSHEMWDVDEILIVTIYLVAALGIFAWRRMLETRQAERVLQRRMNELNQALQEVRQLQGIIPICASCKNIRDDKGYWHQVEAYIHDHSGADFTHGLCPDCTRKLRQDLRA